MKIHGIDFTSRPTRRKPITCLSCTLEDHHLRAGNLRELRSFTELEAMLQEPGLWIAGLDFPFGQSRTFIENIGWPSTWAGCVRHVARMDRRTFRRTLDEYRAPRQAGDKEHRRRTDIAAGSISPQKLYGTPVGLMFFEGAPRLQSAGVTVPGLQQGDPERIVVEAYPGFLARNLIGRRSYKQDARSKQSEDQHRARRELLNALVSTEARKAYGLRIAAPTELADDPAGDRLDALLCAVQAAWAWTQRNADFGMPETSDRLEGWIADPALRQIEKEKKGDGGIKK